ncbi:MAG: hypothetical protein RLO18_02240, partial [Gimesia chilikensis]
RLWPSRWFKFSFAATVGILLYTSATFAFRLSIQYLSREAVIAFIWSAAALILAFLISAHKARWLPEPAWLTFRKDAPPEQEILPPPPDLTSGEEE